MFTTGWLGDPGMNRRSCEKIMVSFRGWLITNAPILPLPLIKASSQFPAGLVLINPRSGTFKPAAKTAEEIKVERTNPKRNDFFIKRTS
jgi:hypothetical protein